MELIDFVGDLESFYGFWIAIQDSLPLGNRMWSDTAVHYLSYCSGVLVKR